MAFGKKTPQPDETCPSCGQGYSVMAVQYPARESGRVACEQCGTLIREWSGTTDFIFTKKTPETGSKNGDRRTPGK